MKDKTTSIGEGYADLQRADVGVDSHIVSAPRASLAYADRPCAHCGHHFPADVPLPVGAEPCCGICAGGGADVVVVLLVSRYVRVQQGVSQSRPCVCFRGAVAVWFAAVRELCTAVAASLAERGAQHGLLLLLSHDSAGGAVVFLAAVRPVREGGVCHRGFVFPVLPLL